MSYLLRTLFVVLVVLTGVVGPSSRTPSSLAAGEVRYAYDANGHLIQVVAPSGASAAYHYDGDGNITSITRSAATTAGAGARVSVDRASRPAVTSVSPPVLSPGVTIRIRGRNFDPNPARDIVQVNGAVARVSSASKSVLRVRMPPFTGSGDGVTVTTSGGSTSAAVPLYVPPSPFSPGAVGALRRDSVGRAQAIAIRRRGQIALLQVPGKRGQRITLTYAFSTFSAASVTLFDPDNVRLGAPGPIEDRSGAVSLPRLPFDGTYTLLLESRTSSGKGLFTPTLVGGAEVQRVAPTSRFGRITGQIRDTNGQPLAGVQIVAGKQRTTSDANGYFLLSHLTPGRHVVLVDATRAGGHGVFEIGMRVERGMLCVLPYTIWLPAIDTRYEVTISSPTRYRVILTTPRIPGLKVILPKGAVIRDVHGHIVHRLGITPIPSERPPFPFPNGFPFPVYFTVQPGASTVAPGRVQVIYPNVEGAPPGTRMPFFGYEADSYGWKRYGYGTVTRDGKSIAPDKGVNFDGFNGVGNGFDEPPPEVGPPPCDCLFPPLPGDTPGISASPTSDGDPVDLATGLYLHMQTDLALPDVIPIDVTRTYRPGDPAVRVFGVGQDIGYSLLLSPIPNTRTLRLMLPDGGTVAFTPEASASSPQETTFRCSSVPGPLFGATVRWNGAGWTLRLRSGMSYDFTSFGASGSGTLPSQTGNNGVLLSIQDPNGNTARLDWDPDHTEILDVKSPHGRWIRFTYTGSTEPRIATAQDDSGRTVRYSYTDTHNYDTLQMTSVTDANGGKTTYCWEVQCGAALGHLQQLTDARRTKYLRLAYELRPGAPYYDPRARVRSEGMAGGGRYTFRYVPAVATGKPVKQTWVTDPRGHVRHVTFDGAGFITSDTYAAGTRQAETYRFVRQRGTHLIQEVIDPLGRRTTYRYDRNGNLTSMTQLPGTRKARTYSYTYDPTFSEVTSEIDPLGHHTTYSYDPSNGNLLAVRDPLGHTVRFTYDREGKIVSFTDALGNVTRFGYNSLGDLTSVTDPLGRTTSQFVDAAGRVTQVTDALGHSLNLTYDNLDNIVRMVDAQGLSTSLTYDPDGNLTSLTTPLGHTTRFSYDARDRLTSQTDPLGKKESYAYDQNDNLMALRDRNGRVTRYSYDVLDRPAEIRFPGGPTIRYNYDKADRLIQVTDAQTGRITDSYDGFDRLTRETSPQGTVSYSYDAADREIGMQASGYAPVRYAYDADDDVTGIRQGSLAVGLSWDADGRETRVTSPGSVSESYTYDAASQLIGIRYAHLSSPLGNLSYGYNADGQVTAVGGSWARTNLPSPVTATYNAADELTRWGSTSLSYDANGNLIRQGKTRYTWNTRDQLVRITSGRKTAASFVYDAFGRRLKATIGKSGTTYLYDGDNPIEELSGKNVTATMLAGLSLDEYYVRMSRGTPSDLLTDALGSTVAQTSAAGAVTAQYTYDPFGNVTVSGHANGNRIQYAEGESDGTGLDFFQARYYSPATGRFISPDPLGFVGGDTNPYAYGLDDPVNLVDPTGMQQQNNNPYKMPIYPKQTMSQLYNGLQPNSPRTEQLIYNKNLTPEQRQTLINQNYLTTEQIRRQVAVKQVSNVCGRFFTPPGGWTRDTSVYSGTRHKDATARPAQAFGGRYVKPNKVQPGFPGQQQASRGTGFVYRGGRLVRASR